MENICRSLVISYVASKVSSYPLRCSWETVRNSHSLGWGSRLQMDLGWMLPFVLHSFKICFKNIFKIKFLFSHNFEPSPRKWKVSLHFGSLSWLLIALASLKMMVSLQQTRRSQPIGSSISKQWISWLTCFFSNLIKAKIFQKISMKYCFIQKLLFPIRLHPRFTHT